MLDVNETVSDLEPLRSRLQPSGLRAHPLDVGFTATLRDGFAGRQRRTTCRSPAWRVRDLEGWAGMFAAATI